MTCTPPPFRRLAIFALALAALAAPAARAADGSVRESCSLSVADGDDAPHSDSTDARSITLAARKPRALADWNVRWHQRQRVWVALTATNRGDAPAAVRAEFALDLQTDGSRTGGAAAPVLTLAPHASGTVHLAFYVPADTKTAAVLLQALTPDASVAATLSQECSDRRFEEGEMKREAAALLDEAIKAYAAEYADPVAGAGAARTAMRVQGSGAQDGGDVAWAMRSLLGALHDDASYILSPGETRPEPPAAPAGPPELSWRDDGLVVLRLPTVDAPDDAAQLAYAKRLHELVTAAAARRPRGWIVDLRGFGAGDPWAPLAALGSLLQGPTVGAFVGQEGSQGWIVERGAVRVSGSAPLVDLHLPPEAGIVAPVAVVIGTGTAGAGEALAIAFEGRPRTRFFGQPTQGRDDSAIDRHTLTDGTVLGIAVARKADRNGVVYRGPIDPDKLVDVSGDGLPHEAVDWLLDNH